MKILKIEQRSAEWFSLRRKKIGASDAPIIMGVSPFKTQYQLYNEKMFGMEEDQSLHMKRGIELEPKAREAFEKQSGILIDPIVAQSDSHEWQIASLDGMDFNRTIIVEIKCPGEKTHKIAKEGKIPDHYYPQLQHQMAVTGIDRAIYFSFYIREADEENGIEAFEEGISIEIKRNDNFISDMIQEEEIFYKRMMEYDSPSADERDYTYLYSDSDINISNRLCEIDYLVKSLEEEKNKLKKLLIEENPGKNISVGNVRLTKVISQGRVDYKAIPELKDVDLSFYRKSPIESWRLTVSSPVSL